MAVGSLVQVVNLIESIVEDFPTVKQFGSDFESEMQNYLTTSEKFHSIFVAIPEDGAMTMSENVNIIRVTVFCHAQIQADRGNILGLTSDNELILADLYRTLDLNKDLEITGEGIISNENNSRLDYLVGSKMDLEFIVDPVESCRVPKNSTYGI